MLDRLKQRYWDWARQRQLLAWSRSLPPGDAMSGDEPRQPATVFVANEFFHKDLRGFGGFGRVIKAIVEHSLARPEGGARFAVALAGTTPLVAEPSIRQYHGSDVALRPSGGDSPETLGRYRSVLKQLSPRAFFCIDWHPSYLTTALALPHTPVLIWIRDPRDASEWRRIGAVPGELAFRGLKEGFRVDLLAREKQVSLRTLIDESRRTGRKLIFCTKAEWLIERARATYGLPDMRAHLLATPIDLPTIDGSATASESERPSLLFLGRLDPVKRPWIAFEIAARHPELDVLVAGHVHQPESMAHWLERYAHLPNLKLLGHVDGAAKDRLLRSCWALLNTSVHEAEPVSFLEAFSHAKPVITSHASEDCVLRHGYFTGTVDGDGMDETSLAAYSRAIALLLSDTAQRREKGASAREMVRTRHSFESFYAALDDIMRSEGIA